MADLWARLFDFTLTLVLPIVKFCAGAIDWLFETGVGFVGTYYGRIAAEVFIVSTVWIAVPVALICRCVKRPEEDDGEGEREE